MADVPLVLPQVCPVAGCLAWLQRPYAAPEKGVAPHFEACHPGMPVPVVATGVTRRP